MTLWSCLNWFWYMVKIRGNDFAFPAIMNLTWKNIETVIKDKEFKFDPIWYDLMFCICYISTLAMSYRYESRQKNPTNPSNFLLNTDFHETKYLWIQFDVFEKLLIYRGTKNLPIVFGISSVSFETIYFIKKIVLWFEQFEKTWKINP